MLLHVSSFTILSCQLCLRMPFMAPYNLTLDAAAAAAAGI